MPELPEVELYLSALRWRRDAGAAIPKKGGLAAFDFVDGTLLLTEVATQKRASLHVVRGEEAPSRNY